MSTPCPSQEQMEALLDRIEAQDQARRGPRRGPGLIIVLMPVWVWALGTAFLPEDLSQPTRVLFHALCWIAFAILGLWAAWSAREGTRSSVLPSPSRSQALQKKIDVEEELQEDLAALVRRRTQPPETPR